MERVKGKILHDEIRVYIRELDKEYKATVGVHTETVANRYIIIRIVYKIDGINEKLERGRLLLTEVEGKPQLVYFMKKKGACSYFQLSPLVIKI